MSTPKAIYDITDNELLAAMGNLLSVVMTSTDPSVRCVHSIELYRLTLERERREGSAAAEASLKRLGLTRR